MVHRFTPILLLLLMTAVAWGYESNKGYRLSEPSGWIVADRDTQGVTSEVRQRFPNLQELHSGGPDVFMFDPAADGFAENINVVVTSGSLEMNESTRVQSLKQIDDIFRTMGLAVREMQGALTTVGANRCLEVSYAMTLAGNDLCQRQFIIPGRDQTYIVTCTSLATTAATYEPIFRTAMNSFTVVNGQPGSWSAMPAWLRGAILGGIVGGIAGGIGAIVARFRGKKRKPVPPSTSA